MISDQYAYIDRARKLGYMACVSYLPQISTLVVELFEVQDYDTGSRLAGQWVNKVGVVAVECLSRRDVAEKAVYHAYNMVHPKSPRRIKQVVTNTSPDVVGAAFGRANQQDATTVIEDDMDWRMTSIGPMSYSSIPGFVRLYNKRYIGSRSLT